jgi:hypothetical protein
MALTPKQHDGADGPGEAFGNMLSSAVLTWNSGPWRALGLDPTSLEATIWKNRGGLVELLSWYMASRAPRSALCWRALNRPPGHGTSSMQFSC